MSEENEVLPLDTSVYCLASIRKLFYIYIYISSLSVWNNSAKPLMLESSDCG